MIVKVLVDNRKKDAEFKTEHGLSFYIETKNHKCMVDVGLSNAFFKNAQMLGVDISEIDYLFLSHGHVDHVGGLSTFLEKNKKARIIVSSKALLQKYYSKRKGLRDISLNLNLIKHLNRFNFIRTDTVLEDDISVLANIKKNHPLPKANNYLYKESSYRGLQLDDFNHELVFCFGKEQKLVCTGCAHSGLLNILDTVSSKYTSSIKWAIGGFHLLDSDENNQYESTQEIEEIASALKNDYTNIVFYTGHCTGDKVLNTLKHALNKQIQPFYAGMQLELNK